MASGGGESAQTKRPAWAQRDEILKTVHGCSLVTMEVGTQGRPDEPPHERLVVRRGSAFDAHGAGAGTHPGRPSYAHLLRPATQLDGPHPETQDRGVGLALPSGSFHAAGWATPGHTVSFSLLEHGTRRIVEAHPSQPTAYHHVLRKSGNLARPPLPSMLSSRASPGLAMGTPGAHVGYTTRTAGRNIPYPYWLCTRQDR